jgi:FkbM family methyltransferase
MSTNTISDRDTAQMNMLRLLRNCSQIDFEALLARQYSKLLEPGMDALDIGAHAGLHSKMILQWIGDGRLTCVEPLPELAAPLIAKRFGHLKNVTVIQAAVGSKNETRSFSRNPGALQESGLIARSGQGETFTVEVIRIDDIPGVQDVKFIKLDVEGGEIDALRGASRLLWKSRPIVACEFGIGGFDLYGYGPDSLFNICSEHDYRLMTLFGGILDHAGAVAFAQSGLLWDYFLVPGERAAEVGRLLEHSSSPFDAIRPERPVFSINLGLSVVVSPHWSIAGFSQSEGWGRWTDSRMGSCLIHFARPLQGRVSVELEIIHAYGKNRSIPSKVLIGDEAVSFTPQDIPGVVRLQFAIGKPSSTLQLMPAESATSGADPRGLGFGVGSITLSAD